MKKLFSILLCFISLSVFADPLKIIVGYKPGSATDITARVYAKALDQAGIPNVVLNFPGAESIIAAKKMVDDDNAILVVPAAVLFSELTMKGDFDFTTELSPLIALDVTEFIGVTTGDDDIRTLLRKDINVCAGNTQTFLKTRQIAEFYGAKWNIVLMQSNAEAFMSLKRGDTSLCFVNVSPTDSTYGANIVSKTGSGLEEFFKNPANSFYSWRGAMVSHRMPAERRAELVSALRKIQQSDDFVVHPIVKKNGPSWFVKQINSDRASLKK